MPVQAFAGADRRARRVADELQRVGVEGLDFQPHQRVGFQRPRQFDGAAEAKPEGHVQRDIDVRPQRLAEGPHDGVGAAQHGRGGVAGRVAKMRRPGTGVRQVAQGHQVGLDGRVAALQHLLGQAPQVVAALAGRQTQQVGVAVARGAAMRPVEAQLVAQLAAQQLPDGRVQGLAANVPQGGVDARHGLPGDAAAVSRAGRRQVPPDGLHLHRVAADDEVGQAGDGGRHRAGRAPIRAIAPADQAGLAGLDFDEGPGAEAAVNDEGPYSCDLHAVSLRRRLKTKAASHSSQAPAPTSNAPGNQAGR